MDGGGAGGAGYGDSVACHSFDVRSAMKRKKKKSGSYIPNGNSSTVGQGGCCRGGDGDGDGSSGAGSKDVEATAA